MKRVIYLLSIVVLLGQSSCNNFLEDSSGDLLIPKSVKEFQALLWGDGYPHDLAANISWMILLSDDVDMRPFNGTTKDRFDKDMGDGLYPYRWDVNIEEKIKDKAWSYVYERILACNNVIAALPTMECEKGEEDKVAWLGGAAHTLRAYYYFCLVNWYAEPYSAGNLNKPGVVIRTEPNITLGDVQRSSIGDTYKLINSDLTTASEYFTKGRKVTNEKLVTEDASKFLANRVALFEGRWADVIKVGNEILKKYGELYNLNNSPGKATFKYYNLSTCFSVLSTNFNPEIIYTFSKPTKNSNPYEYLSIYTNSYDIGFLTSEEGLISTYKANDLRKIAYYRADSIRLGAMKFTGNYLPVKYLGLNANNCYFMNWRSVEVLLNVAEAYARTDSGVSTSAVALLQKLEASRYDGTYVPITVADFAGKEELLEYVLAERRRELAFEETMRWWDIRRLGCEEISHRYYHNRTQFDTYVLPKGSPNFTLQIPASEVDENQTIQRNERVVINKQ